MRGTMIPADIFDKALSLAAEYRAQQAKARP
jgi:hypothetical protein